MVCSSSCVVAASASASRSAPSRRPVPCRAWGADLGECFHLTWRGLRVDGEARDRFLVAQFRKGCGVERVVLVPALVSCVDQVVEVLLRVVLHRAPLPLHDRLQVQVRRLLAQFTPDLGRDLAACDVAAVVADDTLGGGVPVRANQALVPGDLAVDHDLHEGGEVRRPDRVVGAALQCAARPDPESLLHCFLHIVHLSRCSVVVILGEGFGVTWNPASAWACWPAHAPAQQAARSARRGARRRRAQ